MNDMRKEFLGAVRRVVDKIRSAVVTVRPASTGLIEQLVGRRPLLIAKGARWSSSPSGAIASASTAWASHPSKSMPQKQSPRPSALGR